VTDVRKELEAHRRKGIHAPHLGRPRGLLDCSSVALESLTIQRNSRNLGTRVAAQIDDNVHFVPDRFRRFGFKSPKSR